MRSERARMANKYRSEGEEEATKIRAETDKLKTLILSEAYRNASIIRGEGDAEAARIYARIYKVDPEFYQFIRTLEAYKKILPSGVKMGEITLPHILTLYYISPSTVFGQVYALPSLFPPVL